MQPTYSNEIPASALNNAYVALLHFASLSQLTDSPLCRSLSFPPVPLHLLAPISHLDRIGNLKNLRALGIYIVINGQGPVFLIETLAVFWFDPQPQTQDLSAKVEQKDIQKQELHFLLLW